MPGHHLPPPLPPYEAPEGYHWELKITRYTHYDEVPAVPAVTHPEVTGQRYVVTTLKGIPVKTGNLGRPPMEEEVLTQREVALGWAMENIETNQQVTDRTGVYQLQRWKFTNATKKKLGTVERTGFLS